MTKTCYRTGIYPTDHTTFGGKLTSFDFNGRHTMSSMAQRISSDLSFDKQCRNNISLRERTEKGGL